MKANLILARLAVFALMVFLCLPSMANGVVLEQNVPFNNYWPGWSTDLVNLSGSQTLTIKSINVQGTLVSGSPGLYSIKIYSRAGTSVGFESSSSGWTLAGEITANILYSFPTVELFEVPLSTPFAIAPGGTAGLYAVVNNGVDAARLAAAAQYANSETNDGTLQINNAPGRWVNDLFGGVIFPEENPKPQLKVTYEVEGDGDGGCTLTAGYWKKHTDDPVWAMLPGGSSTPFFLSGSTWYQVLSKSSASGNVYYILAQQYIAAKLNILGGADSTAVDAALAWAENTFFNTYTPSSTLSKSIKKTALSYASLLESFNKGYIGPGSCSD